MSSARCHATRAPEQGPPFIQHGNIVFQAHHVGWIVTGIFTVIATITSGWLINKHLQWYTNKREQRYIVRLLFLVPIYATISFASYLFWNHSTPLILIRDGYESTVLSAFFYLLLIYLSPDPDEQKSIFRKVGLSRCADIEARNRGELERKWIFPLGFVKWKPEDGLYFLQLMKWGVLQYTVIRPTTTLAAVILDYAGLYCEQSWQPRWAHIYISAIVSISVTIAMYCLLQLYVPISQHLAPRKPLLKLFAVKAVVFLTFWQATFLSLLSTFGVVKNTKYMTAEDINIGIGALLETLEMTIFAFLHIRAFTYKPYRPFYDPHSRSLPPTRTSRLRSLGHAMDFRETIKEIWTGCVYVVDRIKGREPTSDKGARRVAYLEDIFGRARARPAHIVCGKDESAKRTLWGLGAKEKGSQVAPLEVEVVEQVDVDVEGERQWLGLGDDYAYGLGYARRERSDGLEEQIEQELQRRGFSLETASGPTRAVPANTEPPARHSRRRSWWRTIYSRISNELEDGGLTPAPTKKKSRSSRHSRDANAGRRLLLVETDNAYDELPPASMTRMFQSQRRSGRRRHGGPDTTMPPMTIYDPAKPSQPLATPLTLSQVMQHQREMEVDSGNLPPAMPAQVFTPTHSPPPSSLQNHEPDDRQESAQIPTTSSSPPSPGNLRHHDNAPPHTNKPLPQLPPGPSLDLPHEPSSLSKPSRLRRSSAISNNPSKRPRRQTLPPPSPTLYAGPSINAYIRPRTSNRRTSAPLESIPQHSVPVPPLSSHSRRSHRLRYTIDGTDRNWASLSGELPHSGNWHSSMGNRGGQRSADLLVARRVDLVMPQLLEQPSPHRPAVTPPRREGVSRPIGALTADGTGPPRWS